MIDHDDTMQAEFDRYRLLYAENQKAKFAKSNAFYAGLISITFGIAGLIPLMMIGLAGSAAYYWFSQQDNESRRKRMWEIEADFERRGYSNPSYGQLRRVEA